jgi:hypothetical protein
LPSILLSFCNLRRFTMSVKRAVTSRGGMAIAAAAERADALGLPMTKLHTGWFGSSALVINDEVEKEVGDVVVSSTKCEAVVLDAAGCDALTAMIERKDIKRWVCTSWTHGVKAPRSNP